jgi:hypothetical protein
MIWEMAKKPCKKVVITPAGIKPKCVKLLQNSKFAPPSNTWTAIANLCQNTSGTLEARVSKSKPISTASPCASKKPIVYGKLLKTWLNGDSRFQERVEPFQPAAETQHQF